LAAQVHRTKTRLFRASILSGGIVARPGSVELVRSLVDADIRVAVATTGRRAWVEPLLSQLLGDDIVEVLVAGDDVTQLKPDPEVYSLALARLNLSAANALAVEDSAIGLRAALAAGLSTIVVTNGYTVGQDFSGAATVLNSYDGAEPLLAERCKDLHAQWWTRRVRRS
jgi:HAD superfamily hydrolase (TIGR01509 family)